MVIYRWQDYNLKGDLGNTVVVTTGAPPSEEEKARARDRLLRSMAPGSDVAILGNSRIACPAGTRVEN